MPAPGDASASGYLAVAAATLFALSWLVILPALEADWWVSVLTSAPAVLILTMLTQLLVLSLDAGATGTLYPTPWLPFVAELAAPVALLILGYAHVPRALLVRAGIVALTATAPGLLHLFGVYFLAVLASDANWDTPPGTGLVVSTPSIAAAVGILVLWRDDRVKSHA